MKEIIGIIGQYIGLALFLFIILKYIQVEVSWHYTLPLAAGWIFAVATKVRGK